MTPAFLVDFVHREMAARLKKSQTFTGGSLEQDFALQLAVSHDSSSTVAPCGTLKSHSLW